ncbi:MFS transporter [Pigmentiphaga kullae]|uniref:Putative MFS family arabinose efflux permease n=1 Tax=Pigmentiphaga kullae TaxID=151784 RepID=A0A4Q7NL65_9BURK|nr:MFS transporter [Pigmentiphaga kullae]RZS85799.1 putative MFS family arabinose efflux permease [Pigmentiphaga kullae]
MLQLERVFPALSEPTMRRYLMGQGVSVLGSWTQNVTLNLVVYHLSGSAAVLALLNFLLYGPQLVVAPLAGARVNAANARRSTLGVLYSSMTVACILAALSLLHWLTLPIILALALCAGVLNAIETPSRQVLLLTGLEDPALLPNAIAMNTMVYNVGRMVGPSMAAIIYPMFGQAAAFLTYAAALVFMAWCVRSMPRRAAAASSPSHDRGGLRNALVYVLDDRFTAKYLSILACMGLLAGSYQTLVPLLADRVFHDAARYTGVFFACAGMGALAAAVVLSSSIASRTASLLRFAPWIACVALALLSISWSSAVSGLAFVLLGFCLSFSATSTNATIQRRCPESVRGALVGLYGMAYNGTMPFGYLLVGSFSEAFTVTGAFGTMAAVLATCIGLLTLLYWRKT